MTEAKEAVSEESAENFVRTLLPNPHPELQFAVYLKLIQQRDAAIAAQARAEALRDAVRQLQILYDDISLTNNVNGHRRMQLKRAIDAIRALPGFPKKAGNPD